MSDHDTLLAALNSFRVEMADRLGRIETKQDEFVGWRMTHETERKATDERIASLEESRSHTNGAVAVLYVLFSGAVASFFKKLFG